MMNRNFFNGLKKLRTLIIFGLACVIIGFFGNMRVNSEKERQAVFLSSVKPLSLKMPDYEKTMKKIKVTDVLIENIKNKKELITMETELTQDVTWDDSFTDWDVFKKAQKISFFGLGKYSTDLGELKPENINFSDSKVIVSIPKPVISSLEIDESKTLINSTETGFLRFGEIKISAAEQNELYKKVKNTMNQRLSEIDMFSEAEEKTVESVSELINTFLVGAEIYNMDVEVLLY